MTPGDVISVCANCGRRVVAGDRGRENRDRNRCHLCPYYRHDERPYSSHTEPEYDAELWEFIQAVAAAKKANGWRYPALSEIFAVMKALGYAKRSPPNPPDPRPRGPRDMNWEAIIGTLLAVFATLYGLYEKFRKRQTADDDTTIGQWRTYAREREKQHAADIARLEREIATSRERIDRLIDQERRCAIQAARQEDEIRQLREELADLKRELSEQGIRDGSEHHRPL